MPALCLAHDFSFFLYSHLFSGGIIIQSTQTNDLLRQLDRDSSGEQINSLMLTQNERLVIGVGTCRIFLWEIRSLKRGNLNIEPQSDAFHFTLQNRLLVASFVPPMIATMQRNLKSFSATSVKHNSQPLLFSPDGSLLLSIFKSQESKLFRMETVVTDVETGKISWRLPTLDFREVNHFIPIRLVKELSLQITIY